MAESTTRDLGVIIEEIIADIAPSLRKSREVIELRDALAAYDIVRQAAVAFFYDTPYEFTSSYQELGSALGLEVEERDLNEYYDGVDPSDYGDTSVEERLLRAIFELGPK